METNIISKKELEAKTMEALKASGQFATRAIDQFKAYGGYKHKNGAVTYSMNMASIQIRFRDDTMGIGNVAVYGTWDYDPETTAHNLNVKIVHQTGELETSEQIKHFIHVLKKADTIAEALRAEFKNCKVSFTTN